MTVGEKMFATYAGKYADWVARGCPPSPPAVTHWIRRTRGAAPSYRLLHRIAKAQGDLCSLCGERLHFDELGAGRLQPTIDHVTPRSRGGKGHRNKLVAHRHCNQRKSARMPTGCELVLLAAVNARLFT